MVFLAAVLCGCEVIREEDRLIPMAIVNGERVHVLVEYTGFRCVNCPEAAKTAEALQALYGGQLVVVAMHPATNTFTQGAFDYTCPEADLCYRWMGGTATTPFPTGNIDMKETDSSFFLDRQQWASALLTAMEDDEAPYLHATATADSTGGITVTIQTQALQETEARMALWVTEDSILGAQVMGDGTNNLAYYHRHVLRDALMDEPFGALDAQTRNILQESLVNVLKNSHRTIIFVTHSVDEALYLSDRVIILSRRPATIFKIIDVPGDRPRDRAAPEFTKLRRDILDYLESQNVMFESEKK